MNIYSDIASKIEKADHILIGAGAGLSSTSTIDYLSEKEFRKSFPQLTARGIKTRWEAGWHKYQTIEEHWAFWARHVLQVRFDAPAGSAYYYLLELVKDKPWFVISTNVDHQFIKAGFDEDKVFTTQGNYGYFQCSLPCRQEIWPNEDIMRKIEAGIDEEKFRIQSKDIPRCPYCSCLVSMNLKLGDNFVEDKWGERNEAYGDFIRKASASENFLMLEFGVGFNTPSIIRYPFEWYANYYSSSFFIRFNKSNATVPDSIMHKSISCSDDINEALEKILAERAKLRGE